MKSFMSGLSRIMLQQFGSHFLATFALVLFACSPACSENTVIIHSYILRDRVVVLDRIVMKKALYVAFSVSKELTRAPIVNVRGRLNVNDHLLAESVETKMHGRYGNIIFDLPFEIPDGSYTIRIDLVDERGGSLGQGELSIARSAMKSVWGPTMRSRVPVFREITLRDGADEPAVSKRDLATGYVLFARSPLEYVFEDARPHMGEVIDTLTISAVRNEYEPLTFSLYPLRTLGKVIVSVNDLTGSDGIITKKHIAVGYVDSVQETIGFPEGTYRVMPSVIRPGNQMEIKAGKTRSFWLTVRIDANVRPGTYRGAVSILPEFGERKIVPLTITVAPITLEDIPGKDYFMLMTYEFTELTMPWDKEQKASIERSGRAVFKDYKEHGMTTVCVHSPFIFSEHKDGTPRLEDIYTALRAARDVGFSRPTIWYLGHLIQTAKPRHPGNILGYDERVHPARLAELVQNVSAYAKQNHSSEVIFAPIDEPDDATQDYRTRRQTIAPSLLKTIREAGGKSMLISNDYKRSQLADYYCSSSLNEAGMQAVHGRGASYWVYNNDVTTKCNNPAYARYIYGYYMWKNNIDGMSSWTFQNTQNASGLPGRVDAPGSDLYLAYPDPKGPLATLKWEAVREGIGDHKLLYQLMKRVNKLRKMGINVDRYENFLAGIKKATDDPTCNIENARSGDSNFQYYRERLISLIIDADERLGARTNDRTPGHPDSFGIKRTITRQ
jgi:hypothetical protein